MSTSPVAVHDRAANRGAAVSVVGHGLLLALYLVAAQDTGSSMFWVLALSCALSLVATLLAWASVRTGRPAWDAGVVVLAVALAVALWGAISRGEPVLAFAGAQLVFLDWLVFRSARKALRTP